MVKHSYNQSHGIDPKRIDKYATNKKVFDKGTEVAIVIGGVIYFEEFQDLVKVWIVFKQATW